jgi:glycosyltransferase involved in cell wall biosynthesis
MQSLIDAGVEEKRIRLIHSGIDAHRFKAIGDRSIDREGEPVIGCLAVLEERKGHRYLLRAASILKARGLRVMLHLGGEGTLRGELEREVDKLGLRETVKFCGFVDPATFLANVDLFVLPSLYEGLGVAALEAMASGKAVIASRVGGLTESIIDGQTGLLVPPRVPEALADAIARLVREPFFGRELGRKGRARVLEQFTLEQMAVKNEAFYYELLGTGSP